jgi:plasmid stability protein
LWSAILQIRNVPDDVHRGLKLRAALAGMSLSEFALAELVRSLQRPTREELAERIRRLPPVDVGDAAVRAIREDRDSL